MREQLNLVCLGVVAVLLIAAPLSAQDADETYGAQPTGGAKAMEQFKANTAAFKGNADKLVLPGLVADRKARTVEVLAEGTGLNGGAVAEFLLVDQASSHGYEALLWSLAKPSDVHRALEFIGLKSGTPYSPALARLWSDGDRVSVVVRMAGEDVTLPLEQLIVDNETKKPLPEEGFVFAGSIMVTARDGKGESQYAADVHDPRSVASLYNEPSAVLDVPRHASQGEVYGSQVVNPEYAFAGGELLTIVMTPGKSDGHAARQLELLISRSSVSNGVVCRLSETEGDVLLEGLSLKSLLEPMVSIGRKEGGSIVELAFGDTVPLADTARACAMIELMASMGMVKVKPPTAGQLYYRAFVPNKAWRTPEKRPTQPWELHLTRKDGAVVARMVLNEAVWAKGSLEPTFTRSEFKLSEPSSLRARLDSDMRERQKANRALLPPVLLVFADPFLTYRSLMDFISPVMNTHGTVYVFVEQ
jgi:hypothetical protein